MSEILVGIAIGIVIGALLNEWLHRLSVDMIINGR